MWNFTNSQITGVAKLQPSSNGLGFGRQSTVYCYYESLNVLWKFGWLILAWLLVMLISNYPQSWMHGDSTDLLELFKRESPQSCLLECASGMQINFNCPVCYYLAIPQTPFFGGSYRMSPEWRFFNLVAALWSRSRWWISLCVENLYSRGVGIRVRRLISLWLEWLILKGSQRSPSRDELLLFSSAFPLLHWWQPTI